MKAEVVAMGGNQVCADDNDTDIAAEGMAWLCFQSCRKRGSVIHTATVNKVMAQDS